MAGISPRSPWFGQTSSPDVMNQLCRVCGEPAAGFHFGAFTCEGCKSFFGRTYNNLGSISECKNNGECVINKKNRTSCKACRLRKCLLVGMSKSGSRYGRRSNWFKIHCLLQEQQAGGGGVGGGGGGSKWEGDSENNNVKDGSGGLGGGGGKFCGDLWRSPGLIPMPFFHPGLQTSPHLFPFLASSTSPSSGGTTLPSPPTSAPMLSSSLPPSSFSTHHQPSPTSALTSAPSPLDLLRSPLDILRSLGPVQESPIDLTKKGLLLSSSSLPSTSSRTSNSSPDPGSPPGSSSPRSTSVLMTNPDSPDPDAEEDPQQQQQQQEDNNSRIPLDLTLVRS